MFSISLDWLVREKHKDKTEAVKPYNASTDFSTGPSSAHGQLELKILCWFHSLEFLSRSGRKMLLKGKVSSK